MKATPSVQSPPTYFGDYQFAGKVGVGVQSSLMNFWLGPSLKYYVTDHVAVQGGTLACLAISRPTGYEDLPAQQDGGCRRHAGLPYAGLGYTMMTYTGGFIKFEEVASNFWAGCFRPHEVPRTPCAYLG